MKYIKSLAFIILSLYSFITYSQVERAEIIQNMHHEIPNDAFIPVDRAQMQKSSAYTYKNSTIITTQVNVDNGGNNMIGDAANEPSIAFDPTNPQRIVIGWRQFDTVNSNFRQAGYGYTLDGGATWTFPYSIEAGIFRSDPVLDFDADGNFYYNSLTVVGGNDYQCTVYKIEDGGTDWDAGVFAQGGDKQWMRMDRTDGIGSGNNYSFWTSFYSTCAPNHFTRSTDGSNTFENCVSINGNLRWGTLAVAKNGDLYVAGEGSYNISLAKSTNAKDPAEIVTWDFETEVNLDGYMEGWIPVNPAGLLGQTWVDTDNSDGPGQDNVYVLATVHRISNGDPGDVMFARSTDGGLSFEAPIRINTDLGNNYQWLGTMSVAPNGRIDVVWLDTRDAPTNTPNHSALYYAYSIDQGQSWSENEQVSDYFDPNIGYPQQDKMGDYFDMKSDIHGAHLAWAGTFNGEQDVYYSYITPGENIGMTEIDTDIAYCKVFPNPFKDHINIEFSLREASRVNLDIWNTQGKKVANLFKGEKDAGKHRFKWQPKNLQNGVYYVRWQTQLGVKVQKVVISK